MRTFDGTIALIKKQSQEGLSAFRRGKFDLMGFLLRLVLVGSLATIFAVFFGKFCSVYLGVKSGGVENRQERLFELLSIVYLLLLLSSLVGSATALQRELFAKDDLKLLSAMPVPPRAVYFSGLITVLTSRILFALVTVIPVNIVAAMHAPHGSVFIGLTAGVCLLLPLLSVSIGSILALPFYALIRFLKQRYLLTLFLVTLLAAGGFWLYAQLLGGVKELLLGDNLKYFFSERVVTGISFFARNAYPANLLAKLVLGREKVRSVMILGVMIAVSLIISLLLARSMIPRAMQARIGGTGNEVRRGKVAGKKGVIFAFIKKELIEIFRTPAYAFSCFSIAAILPLMVYFCMSVGSSLVKRLVGLDCNTELALLLTLLFGALCNVFCSTNISREGENFYLFKALPVSAWKVFCAKLFFCLAVSVVAQGISAAVLAFAGYVTWRVSAFLFSAGVVYSFAQICFATRYDFSHAQFSTEEDGAAGESSSAASVVVVLGMLTSFLIGGVALVMKLISALRLGDLKFGFLPYYLTGGLILFFALLSFWYFTHRLKRNYYEFSGGGIL